MQTKLELVRQTEERSMNAWPALHSLLYDGWVLRFAAGYTRRANSVNPLYPSSLPLNEKLPACEERYRERGLPTVFKLTAHSTPPGLDAALAQQGYRTDTHTSLQVLDLAQARLPAVPAQPVELAGEASPAWLEAYYRMSAVSPESSETHARILGNILPQKRFAAVTLDGRIAACGLGVLQDGWIGLYDIVTDPVVRQQGHAGRLIAALLAWAREHGGQHGYLQVMRDNTPALSLYAKLGYREIYRYWYRMKP